MKQENILEGNLTASLFCDSVIKSDMLLHKFLQLQLSKSQFHKLVFLPPGVAAPGWGMAPSFTRFFFRDHTQ
jgi:hypothetical protein